MAGAFPADPATHYAVRLFFSEYTHMLPGTRVFDVTVGGHLALSNFDIAGAAMGQLVGVVYTFLVRSRSMRRRDAQVPWHQHIRQGKRCHVFY